MQTRIKDKKILYIFLLAAIILLIPHLIFFNKDILIGEESYYHLRIARSIIENKFYDNLSYQGRDYFLNPYHFFLALFLYIGSIYKFVPFLLGISSLLLFYLIFKKYFKEIFFFFFISFILVLSPLFIYTFTVFNTYSFFFFLNLLGFFFFFLKDKKYFIISLIIFAIIPFFGLFEMFLTILFLLFYYSIERNNKVLIILLTILTISGVYYINIAYKYNMELPNFLEKGVKDFVIELGAELGFGIFNLLLALIGLILSWKYKKKIYLIYLSILLLFISYYYIGNEVNMYLNFIFSIFAGLALYRLINLRWESKLIKYLTSIILIAGLFFSCGIYINNLTKDMPNKDIIDALEYLKDLNKDNVLTDYRNGFWIEYYGKKSIMDSNFYCAPNLNERFNDSSFVFNSYDLEKTKKTLDKYSIDYIFITPGMKKESKGLLFLFRNKETFKNIYEWNDVEIWEYLK